MNKLLKKLIDLCDEEHLVLIEFDSVQGVSDERYRIEFKKDDRKTCGLSNSID